MTVWTVKQFGRVVDEFRQDCDEGTWRAVLFAFSMLREKGPQCGPLIAKKLKNADGLWELRAGHKTSEPRLLFYFSPTVRRLMIFVHAFIKQSPSDYKPALKLAKRRRALIQRGEAILNDPKLFVVH